MNRGCSLAVVLLVVVGLTGVPAATAAETTTLTVAVETRSGNAVADATIVAKWDGGQTSVKTANNGKAFVDVPDGARVEMVVEHENVTRNFPYVVEDSSEVSGEIEVPVAEKSSLAVTVADSDGAVENAMVAIRWNGRIIKNGATDADGNIATETVEAGTYSVNVLKNGYYEKRVSVDVSGETSETVEIQSGSVPFEFNVTDSHFETPRPVAGATISLDDIGTFKTVQDGLATGRIPVNSEVEMTVSKDGYQSVTRTLTIDESGKTVDVDLRRTPALSVEAANQRVVAGESVGVTVTDEYGTPVAGATVLRNGTSVGTTDDNGQAAIPLDEAGDYSLSATKDGVTADPVTVEAVNPAGSETTTTTSDSTTQDGGSDTTGQETTSDVDVPGFGVGVAIVGTLLAYCIAWRRRP